MSVTDLAARRRPTDRVGARRRRQPGQHPGRHAPGPHRSGRGARRRVRVLGRVAQRAGHGRRPSTEGVERLRQIWLDLDDDDRLPVEPDQRTVDAAPAGAEPVPRRRAPGPGRSCAPFARIEDYPIPFECVATEPAHGPGPLVRPRARSSSRCWHRPRCPAAFPPVEIDGVALHRRRGGRQRADLPGAPPRLRADRRPPRRQLRAAAPRAQAAHRRAAPVVLDRPELPLRRRPRPGPRATSRSSCSPASTPAR